MDLFNKVKSHITNVLPGNPLGSEFDMGEQQASGGPGLMWKIYNGTKKTTKQVNRPLPKLLKLTIRCLYFYSPLHFIAARIQLSYLTQHLIIID